MNTLIMGDDELKIGDQVFIKIALTEFEGKTGEIVAIHESGIRVAIHGTFEESVYEAWELDRLVIGA